MNAEYLRLAIAAVAVMAALGAVAANGLMIQSAVVKMKTDAVVVAQSIHIINATCPQAVGPFPVVNCTRQLGQYYIAYLPAGSIAKIERGWVLGLYTVQS
jgi:hypothetical protein